jgi:hypothetical protein
MDVIKFKGMVSGIVNEAKGSTHLKCTNSASIVIAQMPLNSSRLATITQNESKDLITSTIPNQNHNSGLKDRK